MDEEVRRSWENFLNPEVLRPNLIMAALYIAAFEMLKDSIVERIKHFYTAGFDKTLANNDGWIIDPKYQIEVLSRQRSPVYASLDWLKESRAIDDQDVEAFERTRKTRNDLAHRIFGMLSDGLPSDLPERFTEIIALMDKIERWWIVNVEIPINPDFDNEKIDEKGIMPGRIMGLRALVDIALGSESESKFYISEWLKHTAASRSGKN